MLSSTSKTPIFPDLPTLDQSREGPGSLFGAGASVVRVQVAGTPVNASTFSEAREYLREMVESKRGQYISCANTFSLTLAMDNPGYRKILQDAAWVTADGMPVVWWVRRVVRNAERVHNDDLCLDCCSRFRQWRHFLVGGREGQPEAVARELELRFPGIEIVGTHATRVRPVEPEETSKILAEITASRADIVWVGMGTPAQDYWMSEAAGRLDLPLVAVGSLFDLLTGRTRVAPDWMKRTGLQWAFRLLQEPKRLGARYLVCNTRFVWAAARELAHGIRWNRRRKGPEVTPQLLQIPPVTTSRPAADAVDLSVVIVTHNSASLLGPCLDSLVAECAGLITQILVVDTASSDDSCGFVRTHFPSVHLITCSQNLGFPAANNLALPHCRGRYIALLNPDTIVRPGAFHRLISHLDANPRAGAAGPKLRLADGTVQPECARPLPQLTNLLPWLLLLDKLQWRLRYSNAYRKVTVQPPQGTWLDSFNLLFWERDRSCEVGYICGACMVIRRQVVQEIGLLDESSPMYLDDMDYCRRIGNAGWTIHYVSEAEITHLWQQSSRPLSRETDFYVLVCHSMWLYFRKHEGRLAGSVFALMVCAAGLLRSAFLVMVLPVARGQALQACQRQLLMAGGLRRWALRIQKRPPRLGFACESQHAESPTVVVTQ